MTWTQSSEDQIFFAETVLANSHQVAGLLGPTLSIMRVSEFPLVQPHLYDAQIPPVVYLSGALSFFAGLVLVRAHNLWVRDWRVLVTVTGWFLLVLGLVRMFAAEQYQQKSASQSSVAFVVLEAILLALALIITYFGYRRELQECVRNGLMACTRGKSLLVFVICDVDVWTR